MPISNQQFRVSISNSQGNDHKPQSHTLHKSKGTNYVLNLLLLLSIVQFSLLNCLDTNNTSHYRPIFKGINLHLYLAIHRIKISTENTYYYNYSKVILVKNNKIDHSQNGNRASLNKIKIMQYNKGGSLFKKLY